MGFLTGKSKQTSHSENKAYDYLKSSFGGSVSNGTGANDLVASLLGVGGTPGAGAAGLDAFKNSAGYQNVINGGTRDIEGNAAARGLLRSGSTGQALVNFGQQTANNYYNQYLQNLLGLSGQGMQAGGLIGSAGQVSDQKSTSKPGLGSMLGAGLSMIPGIGTAASLGMGALSGGLNLGSHGLSGGSLYNGYSF